MSGQREEVGYSQRHPDRDAGRADPHEIEGHTVLLGKDGGPIQIDPWTAH